MMPRARDAFVCMMLSAYARDISCQCTEYKRTDPAGGGVFPSIHAIVPLAGQGALGSVAVRRKVAEGFVLVVRLCETAKVAFGVGMLRAFLDVRMHDVTP